MRKTSVSRAESRSDANAVESIAHRETRRRGIQGFLTWSFFLSSVIAVDRALGIGGSRSGDDADLQQHGGPLADDLQLNSLDWSPASATNGDALTSADPAALRSSDFLDPRHATTDGVPELPVLERQDLDFGTLRSSSAQGIFIAVYAAYIGCAGEGFIVDTDHWRHFFFLLAMVWGLYLGTARERRVESMAEGLVARPVPA